MDFAVVIQSLQSLQSPIVVEEVVVIVEVVIVGVVVITREVVAKTYQMGFAVAIIANLAVVVVRSLLGYRS